MLTFILIISVLTITSFSVSAVEFDDAIVLENNTKYIKGEIPLDANEITYKIILNETSKLAIYVISEVDGIQGYLYEENADVPIYHTEITTKNDTDLYTLLEAGTYFFKLKGEFSDFSIKTKVTPYGNLEKKSNNTFASAEKLKKGQIKTGAITLNDRIDVYKFTLKNRKKVNIWQYGTVENSGFGVKYNIYKLNDSKNRKYDLLKKEQIAYKLSKDMLEESERDEYFFDNDTWCGIDRLFLQKGTYYIAIEPECLYDNSLYKIKFETEKPEPAMYTPYGKFNIQKLKIKVNSGKAMYVTSGKVKKWSVSDDKIITVSKSGYVKGIKKGKAEVIATLTDNKKLRCKVIVK